MIRYYAVDAAIIAITLRLYFRHAYYAPLLLLLRH